jgi:hypothetical protein
MRRYAYVGPAEIRRAVADSPQGTVVRGVEDLVFGEPVTYVVGVDGLLRIAHRRSEHVACAGGGEVLAAGELTASRAGVVDVSNQSTGYCPEPESWPAVERALETAGIAHPGRFTMAVIFRRCEACGERNLVKDDWFECALCETALPREWNFAP